MLMEGCFSSVPIPIPMGKTIKIIRNSIHTFLQHYQYFTTTATLAALPFSAAILISQTLSPSLPLLSTICARLHSLFYAAGFPPSSEFFSILSLKLSQNITSSILALPFTLSFLLFAKALVIRKLKNPRKPGPVFPLFVPLIRTQVCNSLVIISANATCFWLALIAFNCLENLTLLPPSTATTLFFSAAVAVAYSVVLANAFIVCNMALVLSGMESNAGGFISVLKACVLIRGRASTALSLALPVNIALAATEALFHYRVVAAAYSDDSGEIGVNLHTLAMVLEGLLIGYLYSILVTIDTITSCVFLKSCEVSSNSCLGDQESRYVYRFEIKAEGENEEDGGGNGSTFANVKISVKELP